LAGSQCFGRRAFKKYAGKRWRMTISTRVSVPILFLIFLTGCQVERKSITNTPYNAPIIATTTSLPILTPSATSEQYTWPSSAKVTSEDNRTSIEVLMYIRESCLRLEITAYGFQWPSSSINNKLSKKIDFFDGTSGNPLLLEKVQEGGGGGGEGYEAQTEDMYLYDIQSHIVPAYISATISFNPVFGIKNPVRFTLQPTPRPNMFCPQLPATTPEG
jgi:hypothetical protein